MSKESDYKAKKLEKGPLQRFKNQNAVLKKFGEDGLRLYKACNGKKSVADMASELGMEPDFVSQVIEWLDGKGMVELTDSEGEPVSGKKAEREGEGKPRRRKEEEEEEKEEKPAPKKPKYAEPEEDGEKEEKEEIRIPKPSSRLRELVAQEMAEEKKPKAKFRPEPEEEEEKEVKKEAKEGEEEKEEKEEGETAPLETEIQPVGLEEPEPPKKKPSKAEKEEKEEKEEGEEAPSPKEKEAKEEDEISPVREGQSEEEEKEEKPAEEEGSAPVQGENANEETPSEPEEGEKPAPEEAIEPEGQSAEGEEIAPDEASKSDLNPVEKTIKDKYGEVGLKVYALIDGQKTAEEIMNDTGVSEAKLIEMLEFMEKQGIIKLEHPEQKAAAEAEEEKEKFAPLADETGGQLAKDANPIEVPARIQTDMIKGMQMKAKVMLQYHEPGTKVFEAIDGKMSDVDLSLRLGIPIYDVRDILSFLAANRVASLRHMERDEVSRRYGEDCFAIYKKYGREGVLLYELIGKDMGIRQMAILVTKERDKFAEMFVFVHKILGIDIPIDKDVIFSQLGAKK